MVGRHSRHSRHSTGEREEGSGDGGTEAAEEEALGDEEVLGVGGTEERGEVQSGVDVRECAKGQEVVGDDGAAQRARGDGEQGVVVGEEEEGTLVEVEGGGAGGVGHGRVGELEGDEGEMTDHV